MMRNKKAAGLVLCILLFGIAAGILFQNNGILREPSFEKQIFAMDTYMTFRASGEKSKEAVEAAVSEIQRLDELLSATDPSSEVFRLNEQGGGVVSEDISILLERGMDFYETTGGLFDLTVYPLMELWGFPSGNYHVPSETEIQNTLKQIGFEKIFFDGKQLKLSEGQKIDFGAIAKGYASDRVIEIYRSFGIENGMVSLGGNIKTLGLNSSGQPWKIGIQSPWEKTGEIAASVRVTGKAVVTSGGYERFFEEQGTTYIHIMNPKTGFPAESDLSSVTIISEDGTLADALSTAIYLMGSEQGTAFWRKYGELFEMVLIDEQGKIYATEGIAGEFESRDACEILEK